MSKFPKMNPKLKRDWIAALRSGKFRQGGGKLREEAGGNPRYCCLGVLCEISGVPFDGDSMFLPATVRDLAGLASYSGSRRHEVETLLANMNDGCGPVPPDAQDEHTHSFPEIATWIEKNL